MRLLLNSKDCVRLGLMNGCECALLQIIFADEEALPEDAVSGAVYELEYIPIALLLRVEGAAWTLPPEQLPKLAPKVDRRGLFFLSAAPVTIRVQVAEDTYINIKRIGFPVAPADARIDYGAQGETWDAVVGDLARPPKVSVENHWLHVYVILSRASSLEGFLALRLPPREDLNVRPPRTLLDEIDRLAALERHSATRLRCYLESLDCSVPANVLALFKDGALEEEQKEIERLRAVAGMSTPCVTASPSEPSGSTLPSLLSSINTSDILAGSLSLRKRLRYKTPPHEALSEIRCSRTLFIMTPRSTWI